MIIDLLSHSISVIIVDIFIQLTTLFLLYLFAHIYSLFLLRMNTAFFYQFITAIIVIAMIFELSVDMTTVSVDVILVLYSCYFVCCCLW